MKKIIARTTAPLAVLLLAATLAACGDSSAPAPQPPQPIVQGQQLRFPPGHPQLALLRLSAATPSKSIVIDLPARLVWNEERTQRLYPPFAGRVAGIRADVGQAVKPGSVLALLASPDFGVAQADTAKAQADARNTEKNLQRQKELFEAGIVARKDLDQAETDAMRAHAEVSRAQARTSLYGAGAGVNQQLALVAGINGVVVERNLNPGQEVRPDQSGPGVPALFVLTDPTSLWVQIDAREAEIGALKPGAPFQLLVPTLPGQVFEGKVGAASDFIDPATRTIKIRGVIANPNRLLKAEMLASARVQLSVGDGVAIPAQAVMLRGTQKWVFVQTQPDAFEYREVVLRYEGPKEVVVARGLAAGEKVVSENALLLSRAFANANSEQQKADTPAAAKAAQP